MLCHCSQLLPSFRQIRAVSPEIGRFFLDVLRPRFELYPMSKTLPQNWLLCKRQKWKSVNTWSGRYGGCNKICDSKTRRAALTTFIVWGLASSWSWMTWHRPSGLFSWSASLTWFNWANYTYRSTVWFVESSSYWILAILPSPKHNPFWAWTLGPGFSPAAVHCDSVLWWRRDITSYHR